MKNLISKESLYKKRNELAFISIVCGTLSYTFSYFFKPFMVLFGLITLISWIDMRYFDIKYHIIYSQNTINHVKKAKFKKEIDAIIDKSSKVRK